MPPRATTSSSSTGVTSLRFAFSSTTYMLFAPPSASLSLLKTQLLSSLSSVHSSAAGGQDDDDDEFDDEGLPKSNFKHEPEKVPEARDVALFRRKGESSWERLVDENSTVGDLKLEEHELIGVSFRASAYDKFADPDIKTPAADDEADGGAGAEDDD